MKDVKQRLDIDGDEMENCDKSTVIKGVRTWLCVESSFSSFLLLFLLL